MHLLATGPDSLSFVRLFVTSSLTVPPSLPRTTLGLVPSTSIITLCLIQSPSYLHSTCPNYLNLLFLITKLTKLYFQKFSDCFISLRFFLFKNHTSIYEYSLLFYLTSSHIVYSFSLPSQTALYQTAARTTGVYFTFQF